MNTVNISKLYNVEIDSEFFPIVSASLSRAKGWSSADLYLGSAIRVDAMNGRTIYRDRGVFFVVIVNDSLVPMVGTFHAEDLKTTSTTLTVEVTK